MSRVAPFRSIFTNFSKHFFLCDTSGESVRSQSESYNKISNKTNKFDFLTEKKSEERKKSLRALAPHSYNWAKFTITSGTLSLALAFLIFFREFEKRD